jgi:hypothetical protein
VTAVAATHIACVFVDDCMAKIVAGTLDTVEYLVCRMFADSRVQRIYGGDFPGP